MMKYQSLQHDMDNLLHSDEVLGILQYHGNLVFIYRRGLFDNPSFLVFRICTIFWKIRLDLPDQQDDTLDFFFWLRDMFMPFLAQAEQYIPDVRQMVDDYMGDRNVPTVENMLSLFRTHFSEKQVMVVRFIFFTQAPKSIIPKTIFGTRPITGLALAKLHGNRCEVLPIMAARVGFPIEELTMLLSNLENLSRIQGKPFYGKLLTLSIAQNILIDRMFSQKNLREKFLLLMRVLSRSFA
jgi:hypothetical protein